MSARSISASTATPRRPASVHCVLPTEARHGNYRGGVHGGAILTFADYALCLVAGRAADGGTNTSFAMTVSIAVEFLSAGQIGAPLEATGEPLQVTGRMAFARGSITQQGKTIALWSGVVRHVARTKVMGRKEQAAAAATPRAADRARRLRAAVQRQRLLAPHRPVLCAQGSRRRDADPADPAAHVQLGRRAARRLHDELRRFGGDARRRHRHRHGAEHGLVRRRVPRRRRCRLAAGHAGRGPAPRQVLAFLRGLLEQNGKPLLSYSATIFLRPKTLRWGRATPVARHRADDPQRLALMELLTALQLARASCNS